MALNAQGRRLKVAYIVGTFPNLSETFVVNQIAGVAARGHIVDVYATWHAARGPAPPEVERNGLLARTHVLAPSHDAAGVLSTVALLIAAGWRTPRMLWRLCVIVLTRGASGAWLLLHAALTLARRGSPEYDVIHAQFGPLGVLALQLVQVGAVRGPVVTSFRGYDLGKYLAERPGAYSDLLRRGTMFLPVSRTLAERLIAEGAEPEHMRVHHSGVSCRRLSYRAQRPTGERVRLITVARLVEKKGISYAIRAVGEVLASGRNVHYTIVGDGPLRVELERLIWELDLGSRVRLAGAKRHQEAIDMIRASHILIAPSVTAKDGDEEGIPNAMKEAMAIGLPVIGTRHGGIPELIEDGVSGLLVPERDIAALADRMTFLIDRPDLWESFARSGRRRIEAEYDIDRLNDELVELYRDLAARQAAGTRSSTERANIRARGDSVYGAKTSSHG